MILKKIMNFFCGRSLEKEMAKTNALIREVEQHEKAAMERLKAQADDYRAQVVAYKKKRDAELKDFIAFMNNQLSLVEVYVPRLGDFQDKMFVCFDSWMNTSIAEQKIKVISECITTKLHMMEFITALQVELNKLSQRHERNEWRHMIKDRPILVSSTIIERTVRQVDHAQKSSSESIRHDLSRLKSRSITLQAEIKQLRHERDLLIASSREFTEKHEAHKAELNDQYRKCSELFGEIKDGFSDHFGSAATGSSLADSWIAEIEGAVTLPKLFLTHKETADIQREVQDEFNNLTNDFQAIRSRIDASRQSGDFSTFSEDKAKRDRLFRERQEVGSRRREVSTARKVIYERGNELKEMLGKFDSLQPDVSIRRIVEIFCMGKDFDVHRAIGVSTREDRRKHYELKNHNR
jgi:Skp family chaperone for outer membrane proteins